jgi:hypothetical protein
MRSVLVILIIALTLFVPASFAVRTPDAYGKRWTPGATSS